MLHMSHMRFIARVCVVCPHLAQRACVVNKCNEWHLSNSRFGAGRQRLLWLWHTHHKLTTTTQYFVLFKYTILQFWLQLNKIHFFSSPPSLQADTLCGHCKSPVTGRVSERVFTHRWRTHEIIGPRLVDRGAAHTRTHYFNNQYNFNWTWLESSALMRDARWFACCAHKWCNIIH